MVRSWYRKVYVLPIGRVPVATVPSAQNPPVDQCATAPESCAEYVKAYRLRRGSGAPASWDLILVAGDRITVMDPLCASNQLLRFYDMKINCNHRSHDAAVDNDSR